MAEALVSSILDQLALILRQQIDGNLRLIRGADDDVSLLRSNFQAIQAVVDDAEKRQVKEQAVRDWLDKLKDTSYDIEDVLDEWNTAIRKLQMERVENGIPPRRMVCSFIPSYWFSSRQVVMRQHIATEIKILNETLDHIAREKDMFSFSSTKGTNEVVRPRTTSIIDESMIHGRDHLKNTVVNLLLCETSQTVNLPIISLVGMGGIGKTTLAKLAFNHNEVNAQFDIKTWVCVSEPFEEIRIAKAILESLKGIAPNIAELETILLEIRRYVVGRKFLLVLDDVWTEESENWEQILDSLKVGSRGSRILVTTRKENVANIMGTTNMIPVGLLLENDSWSIFSRIAFFGRGDEECAKLENIGRKIVDKCKGLPLAIKTLGSLLRLKRKTEEWQRILDSELWALNEVEEGLFPPLLLSYYDLSSILKKCFSYCAIFPKDYSLEKETLIKLWMAQDYLKVEGREDMELVGEEYFENLASRSFFQDFERSEYDGSIISCKMHDIMHDFSRFLTKTECFCIEMDDHKMSPLEIFPRKARHLMINCEKDGTIPSFVYDEIKLRSFVLNCDFSSGNVRIDVSKLFHQLTCLRMIDLRYLHFSLREVSNGIKKLIHLRYLNLSSNSEIRELPEELCDLYNLQTLDISICLRLKRLPQRMGELINLRHLINFYTPELRYMPKGIERLTYLRTLREFVISTGGSYDSKACALKCLNSFKHLQGSLKLLELGNLEDIGDGDEQVELKSKMNLLDLSLRFDNKKVEHQGVLEYLQPPPCLERLEIKQFNGETITPKWMGSLTKLRVLNLSYCSKCLCLPALLAKLPSLESLRFQKMESVKRVDHAFLGIQGLDMGTIIAFPRLKHLKFKDLNEWEEWDGYEIMGEDIKIMPCLRELEISDCNKLEALPDYLLRSTTLNRLAIEWAANLASRYRKVGGEDWPKIAHIPNTKIFPPF